VPNSTLWKLVLLPGVATYVVGFILALGQTRGLVHATVTRP
jgi:UPF0716 family protein affecting phage T7 exclusion